MLCLPHQKEAQNRIRGLMTTALWDMYVTTYLVGCFVRFSQSNHLHISVQIHPHANWPVVVKQWHSKNWPIGASSFLSLSLRSPSFDEFSICPYTAAVIILDKMNQALALAAYDVWHCMKHSAVFPRETIHIKAWLFESQDFGARCQELGPHGGLQKLLNITLFNSGVVKQIIIRTSLWHEQLLHTLQRSD